MGAVSVVMSTYNREKTLPEAVNSILEQSFSDFEFIIINDASSDNTESIIKSYSDSRIKYLKNKKNCGCSFNYHIAHNIAKGKYIVHIDDDDISKPDRIQRQTEFLEDNSDIALLGTYIETFGEKKRPSWVFYCEPKMIELVMNLYNPLCHSSVMYRKSYFDKNFINYDINKRCSQDYDLYKQVILSGGKIAVIPEVLVRYRMHENRITNVKNTQNIQIEIAENIKKELLSRFFTAAEAKEFNSYLSGFPFNKYGIYSVITGLDKMKKTEFSKNNGYEANIDKLITDIKKKKFVF